MPGAIHGVLLILLVVSRLLDADTIRLPIYKQHTWKSKRFSYHQKKLDIRSTPANTDTSKASLYNDAGSEYLVTVGVGTPAQKFLVALDTGSADLWVPSISCPKASCPYTRYNESLSSTFIETEEGFDIVYGIGSANGTYAIDTVEIGGAQVDRQQFGLVETTENVILIPDNATIEVLDEDEDDPVAANGILGIGYPELTSSEHAYDPFVFSLARRGLIPQPIFSIYMGSIYDDGWAGEIIFGGIDESKYSGQLLYAPVARLGGLGSSHSFYAYWMVYGQAIRVLDNNFSDSPPLLDVRFSDTRGVIIDTGTTLTYMAPALAEQIVLAVAGSNSNVILDATSGIFIINCDLKTTDRRVEFGIGSHLQAQSSLMRISLAARDLIIPLDSDSLDDAELCMFGIAPWLGDSTESLSTSSMILVGDSILRSLYLVFDMDQNNIGFAPAVNSSVVISKGSMIYSNNNGSDRARNGDMDDSEVSSCSVSFIPSIVSYCSFIVLLLYLVL
ncbi:acid protease [Lichtheimia hyalospora FSU 10163]|nr:acid protease [Lichtheimia hyalospora FSU 10163]